MAAESFVAKIVVARRKKRLDDHFETRRFNTVTGRMTADPGPMYYAITHEEYVSELEDLILEYVAAEIPEAEVERLKSLLNEILKRFEKMTADPDCYLLCLPCHSAAALDLYASPRE